MFHLALRLADDNAGGREKNILAAAAAITWGEISAPDQDCCRVTPAGPPDLHRKLISDEPRAKSAFEGRSALRRNREPLLAQLKVDLRLSFINPPPAGLNKDYTADPSYEVGSTVTVSWSQAASATGLPVTLALFQQALGDEAGDSSQEVLVDASIAGKTKYTWVVSTKKNLTFSSVFFFELFLNESTSPDTSSHYFNITQPEAAFSTTAATTTTFSAAALSSESVATTLTSATSSPSTSSPVTSTPATSSGLSSGAKVGIGVGIAVPLSLALGGIAGWLCYKRRTKPTNDEPAELPNYTPETKSGSEWGNESTLSPIGGSQHTYNSRQLPFQLDGEDTQFNPHKLQEQNYGSRGEGIN
ncbi:hypothetical protein VP1G_07355 [Cytospora mali]|uniref:Mid2 domain-containing protein n=1 Tax=Cytospora mali TaxID=578113 RepID=A0A194V8J6_CYTMA|nr:hypothetical protein VP1G_07355 [Valsa mali var. pyri (nom. inval.)]